MALFEGYERRIEVSALSKKLKKLQKMLDLMFTIR